MNDFPLKKFAKDKEEKKHPIKTKWIPLGETYAAKFTLWENNLQIEKLRKEEGKWNTYDKINLSKRLMMELCPKLPIYIEILDQLDEKR